MKKTTKILSFILTFVITFTASMVNVVSNAEETDGITIESLTDALYFEGHYYQLIKAKLNWEEAKELCEELGGHLVTINSKAENDFMVEITKGFDNVNCIWLGAYRDREAPKNEQWKWITGEEFSYKYWRSGEPNDYSADENYLEMYVKSVYDTGRWNDTRNIGQYTGKYSIDYFGIICEWETNKKPDSKFGWPVINTNDTFGYDAQHRLSIFDHFYVNELNISSAVAAPVAINTDGFCFGLSLLALADYNGQIDLSAYFDIEGSSLNEFGYDSIGKITTKNNGSGNAYILEGNTEIIKLIEKAQLSQFSSDLAETEVLGIGSVLSDFVDYCAAGSNRPLVIDMIPERHAVAVDPTKRVEVSDNGIYIVWLYDSNSPMITNKIEDQIEVYDYEQSFLAIDVINDKWAYAYNGKIGSWHPHYSIDAYESGGLQKGFKTIRFFDISNLDSSFFYSKLKLKDNAVILNMSELTSIKIDSINDIVFSLTHNGYKIYNDAADYLPYLQGDDFVSAFQVGCLTLPAGKYTFTTDGEASFIRCIDDYMVSMSADDGLVVDFDDENKNITIKNTGDKEVSFEFGVENIQNSSADVVKGKIEPKKEIHIDFSGVEADSASVITTTGKLNNITTSFIQNNEETDTHYHKCAYADTGHLKSEWITEKTATCIATGSKYIECIVCHEVLSTDTIPATGHTDNNNDNICDSCGEKIKQDVDTNCNHICHTNNKFMKFLWNIFNFFMKLFSMERICSCGVAHY